MSFYFIRHAITKANQIGAMVKNYKESHIIPFDPNEWRKKIGKYLKIPYNNDGIYVNPVLVSNTNRTRETAETLFPKAHIITNPYLNEFDCSGLGDKKYWEINEEEFNKCITFDEYHMYQHMSTMFKELTSDMPDSAPIICVTHGMFMRYLWSYVQHKPCRPYEAINSKFVKIENLDMLELNYNFIGDPILNIYHYKGMG